MKMMRPLICLLLLGLLSACGGDPPWLPRAHKITIQQGNLVNQEQLARVNIGMEREMVRNLIGTPVIATPFQADRWDYVYTQGPAGNAIRAKRVTINFVDNKVASIDDNQDLESGELPPQRYFWERDGEGDEGNVDVLDEVPVVPEVPVE